VNNEYDEFFALSVIANVLQIANYFMNVEDLKNTDLMKELQKQNIVLDEQTHIYLEKIVSQNELIIKQNEEIIDLLKK